MKRKLKKRRQPKTKEKQIKEAPIRKQHLPSMKMSMTRYLKTHQVERFSSKRTMIEKATN